MSELFNRDVSVQVGTWKVESRQTAAQPILRMGFKVEASTSRDPNKAQLQLWNLSKPSRAAMQTKGMPVILEAGYVDFRRRLFSGEMNFGGSSKQGVDWVTTLQAGDGAVAYRTARINQSLKGPINLQQVVKMLADKAKVGVGNALKEVIKKQANPRGGKTQEIKGIVLTGLVSDLIDDAAKTLGLEWSIQGGQLQFLEPTATTEDLPIRLTLDNGLIGSPEFGEKGIVKVRTLLNGDIFPGRRLEIISFQVDGFFKAIKVMHTGDTWGGDWYSDVEAQPL